MNSQSEGLARLKITSATPLSHVKGRRWVLQNADDFDRSVPRKPRPVGGVKGHNIMINHCREAPRCARGASLEFDPYKPRYDKNREEEPEEDEIENEDDLSP